MKKTYVKPQIMFESFTLSINIAGNCEVRTNTPSNSTCGLTFSDGSSVFLNGMGGCSTIQVGNSGDTDGSFYVGNDDYDYICYDVPYGDNLFNS